MEEKKQKQEEVSEETINKNETQEKNETPEEAVEKETEQTETVEEQKTEEQIQQEKVTKLEEQCADYIDKYQRCLAEFDNFRKRTIKEKASMYDDGVRSTIEKLLPVVDNLERAVAVQNQNNAEDSFYKGVAMTLKQFQEILTSMGVEEIKALGETFNPNKHAAVAHEDNEEYGENIVILEMQKGYQYKDKVIRHSMVKVAN
ncbi:nucleotide exchange factor GrpE [Lachnospiraceae bacterium 46-61]